MRFSFFCLLIINLFLSCNTDHSNKTLLHRTLETKNLETHTHIKRVDTSVFEKYLLSYDLIDIQSLDTSIRVELAYATNHNFLKKVIYLDIKNAYLPCEMAIKLANAQYYLHQFTPNYHVIVFDAVRPLVCQQKMWDELALPFSVKINYLAHPNHISLHNYGAAVDVGIISDSDVLLDMGTAFDSFNELSEPKKEWLFYKNKKLTKAQYANRLLLRKVMVMAGFTTIATEWWHFNADNKATATLKYKLVN